MTREESIDFYKTHSRRLYNVSLRIVKDSALAEEIMQDTILKFLTHPLPGNGASVAAWLSKTCIHASIDALRKLKRERLFLEEYSSDSFTQEPESPEFKESLDIDKIRRAIDGLRDPYRLVLNLVLIEGLDYEEISLMTGEKEGTIRTQYSRARKMLETSLRNISQE